MIVFDLSCPDGHRFEAWFGSSGAFDEQRKRGLVECPQCGSNVVDKAPMAPAVPVKSNARQANGAVLVTAPSWESVDSLFARDRNALVLATPDRQPAPGRCDLPMVLLLEDEPAQAPPGVSDWLVFAQLSVDVLRRCLRHVRERGVTEYQGERPVRSRGTVQDVTEVRLAQQALQQLTDSLEEIVRSRTRQLEEIIQGLRSFAGMVSHDLSGPLRNASSLAELALHDFRAGDVVASERSLEMIRREAQRASTMVNDLLTLARVDQGPPNATPVDMQALLRECLQSLALQYPSAPSVVQGAALPVVQADASLMRHVLMNLLGNALKFGADRADLRITVEARKDDGGAWRFSVVDNGPGFDPSRSGELFQPFSRLGERVAGLAGVPAADPKLRGAAGGALMAPRAMTAEELSHSLERFDAAWPELQQRYPERFRRMWRYYLLACAGTFRARDNQLWQLVLSPRGVTGGYRRPLR